MYSFGELLMTSEQIKKIKEVLLSNEQGFITAAEAIHTVSKIIRNEDNFQ